MEAAGEAMAAGGGWREVEIAAGVAVGVGVGVEVGMGTEAMAEAGCVSDVCGGQHSLAQGLECVGGVRR